jgi:SpoVK/Ycf46/Vps4 family AAA+-type ATPase
VQVAEFELTDKGLKLLGLDKTRRADKKRDAELREPKIRLADLALPSVTAETVALALGHVRHTKKLMDQWGLRGTFPYGTGATMLFYGPPGTGKTATAEAIAHELGKPLLVADYSQIQNCFVGQTEKNISAIFRKARQNSAVLFWDEADAMFFDRDRASQAWEVRDVNMLLQQIERFEGVCILSTNRRVTLDKALERRITAKVEFPRPDRALRETIWKKLLPKKLPIAKDVQLSDLSAADLSGGEIKNVILNAARLACVRSESRAVTAEDFRKALKMETGERWAGKSRQPAGFNAK